MEGVVRRGRIVQAPGIELEETGLGFKGGVSGFHDVIRRESRAVQEV